jgi:uncharacterized membrane protein YjjP (DUF1212 family)
LERERLGFVLRLGQALHRHGFPAHRLEDTLGHVSWRLGLLGQFFATPTALFASFGAPEEQRTFQIRAEAGAVDLGRQARLEAVGNDVAEGTLEPALGAGKVAEIDRAPSAYGAVTTTLAYALTSATAARIFGGGLREVEAAVVLGLVMGLLALAADRLPTLRRVFEPVAAALAATLATAWAIAWPPLSTYTALVAGLIVLIPGFSLTVAMIELATRHLVSGTARAAGAVVTFLAIGFGVALGTRLVDAVLGSPRPVVPVPLPGWTQAAALLASPLGFTILLRAHVRDVPVVGLAGALAFGGARLGTDLLGPELGAFLGALVVGVASNAYERATGHLGVVPLVPGMLLLVPGSLGFSSFQSLLSRDTLLGVATAFRVVLVAVSIAMGILFANVALPPRRRART